MCRERASSQSLSDAFYYIKRGKEEEEKKMHGPVGSKIFCQEKKEKFPSQIFFFILPLLHTPNTNGKITLLRGCDKRRSWEENVSKDCISTFNWVAAAVCLFTRHQSLFAFYPTLSTRSHLSWSYSTAYWFDYGWKPSLRSNTSIRSLASVSRPSFRL